MIMTSSGDTVTANRLAQRRDAVRRRVAVMAVAQRFHGGFDDMLGRAEIRLADAEIDDIAALGCQFGGARQNRKGVLLADAIEGRDGAKHGSSPVMAGRREAGRRPTHHASASDAADSGRHRVIVLGTANSADRTAKSKRLNASYRYAKDPRGRHDAGGETIAGDVAMSDAKANPHWGSTLDEFLDAEGIREAVRAEAITRVVAWQLGEEMKRQGISKTELAVRMNTSRAQVDRILKAKSNVTIETLQRAAELVGGQLRLELV
jgi:antitoxin HicB